MKHMTQLINYIMIRWFDKSVISYYFIKTCNHTMDFAAIVYVQAGSSNDTNNHKLYKAFHL